MAKSVKLGVIPGDGICPEVIRHAVAALELAAPRVNFEKTDFNFGARRYLATGTIITEAEM